MKTERPLWVILLINTVIWGSLFFIPFLLLEPRGGLEIYFVRVGATAVLTIIFYYINYFYFIPGYLFGKKQAVYLLLVLLTMVFCCFLVDIYHHFVVSVVEHWHRRPPILFSRGMWVPMFPFLTAAAIGISIRVAKELARTEEERRELQNEKLSSELAFLKSQVNPHFLFNTLNNICSLARKKSDDTEPAIIKLSQIMRYMLNDSRQDKVSLDDELEYLNNFIELQKIRVGDKAEISFNIEGDVSGIQIEPLLLIPFVENAFKHGVTYKDPCVITIGLKAEGSSLLFTVGNTKHGNREQAVAEDPGIGLKNVRRRLELLYPGKHHLEIKETESTYSIQLRINCHDQVYCH